jgi:hypothetical protein
LRGYVNRPDRKNPSKNVSSFSERDLFRKGREVWKTWVRTALEPPMNETGYNTAKFQAFDGCDERKQMSGHRRKHSPCKIRLLAFMPFERLGWEP